MPIPVLSWHRTNVFITTCDSSCSECSEDLDPHAWITLVEAQVLEEAERECLADSEARARRREREAERREGLDQQCVESFAAQVAELFPACPLEKAIVITERACQKYSGQVGCLAAARRLKKSPVRLAIIAHIRHTETGYDELLANGYERYEARALIHSKVNQVLARWSGKA